MSNNSGGSTRRFWGLREKTIVQVGVLVIITFLAIMMISSSFFRSTLLDATNENMLSLTTAVATEIDNLTLRSVTLTQSMVDFQIAGGFRNRSLSEAFLRTTLESNAFITGTYIGFEPNADGNDGDNIGASSGHDEQGRFLPYWYRDQSSILLDPLLDTEISDYYLGPQQTGRLCITEPFIYEGVMLVSISAPILIDGDFKGIAGVDIAMDDVATYLKEFTPYQTSKFYLLSSNGNFIAAPDSSYVGTSYKSDQFFSNTFTPLLTSESRTYKAARNGENLMYAYSSIESGNWVLVIEVEEDEVLLPLNRINTFTYAISAVGVLVIMALIFIMVGKALAPIKPIIHGIEKLSSGDFTVIMQQTSKDEIGDIASALNNMIGNLGQFFSNVSENATTVMRSSESLAAASEEMSASLEEVSASSQEFSGNAQSLNQHAELMGEMGKNTTQQAQEGNEAVENTVHNMQEISLLVGNLKEVVTALGNRARDISKIVDTIKDFADQTNLLALNASIEAARAGEHGKGFSVVAEEVIRLAEKSAKSASEIAGLVTDIDSQISGVTLKMDEGVEIVQHGTKVVTNASEVLKSIISNMASMSEQIEKVLHASVEIGAGSEEVSAAVEEQTATMMQISNAASDLQNMVNDLEESLARFKY